LTGNFSYAVLMAAKMKRFIEQLLILGTTAEMAGALISVGLHSVVHGRTVRGIPDVT
jgi:hypothetical protein